MIRGRHGWLFATLVAAAVITTSRAHAEPPELTAAAAATELHGYYGGEALSAYVIGGAALAAASTGGYLVTRDDPFARSLGWSWVTLGGLELVSAVAYAFQVEAETQHYRALLARDPAAYRSEESEHLRGTSARFVVYRAVELGLVVGGIAALVYGAAGGGDAWKGAGLGVLTLSLPLAVIDTFNDRRASRYLENVTRLHPAVGVHVGGRSPAYALSVGGTF